MRSSFFMDQALIQARSSADRGEIPVGAILVNSITGEAIAASGNRMRELSDPTAHAEILVIRAGAQAFGCERLINCNLYVTLEPCPMCASAIALARIKKIIYGAPDFKGGGVDHGARIFDQSSCNHHPEIISGIREKDSEGLLRDFFVKLR